MITSFRNEYYFLSNFYPCKIVYEGLEYECVEGAYQAAKSLDIEERKRFCFLSGKEAKALGHRITIREDWDKVKFHIMEDLVRYKFTHSNKLKYLLLQTGDEPIAEYNSWGDTYWGICNGVGSNWLGRLLMKTRDSVEEVNKKRYVLVSSVVNWLYKNRITYLRGLYEAFNALSDNSDVASFYANKYVKKWMDMEYKLRIRGINIIPSKDSASVGLAVNFEEMRRIIPKLLGD